MDIAQRQEQEDRNEVCVDFAKPKSREKVEFVKRLMDLYMVVG